MLSDKLQNITFREYSDVRAPLLNENITPTAVVKLLDDIHVSTSVREVAAYRRQHADELVPKLQVPKILFFDIETTPITGHVWRPWKTNLIQLVTDWSMYAFAWKWLDGTKTNYIDWFGDNDEKALVEKAHSLLNDCDYVVAHNGDRFDIRRVQAKFLEFKLSRVSPFVSIDTKKVAQKHFGFTYNTLDHLTTLLTDLPKDEKLTPEMHEDLQLNGKKSKHYQAFKHYTIRDVDSLEQLFLRLRPYISNLNYNLFNEHLVCTVCGGKLIQTEKVFKTSLYRYAAWLCVDCGNWVKRERKR